MRRAVAALAVALSLASVSHGRATAGPVSPGAVANSLGMQMVLLPAGSFTMGSPLGAPLRQDEELPHRVTLTRAFRIAATEVTQRQWAALMPADPGAGPAGDLPVASVSWKDAEEFCLALSRKEGARYRLPTEAEWEYACRAGGDDPPPALDLDAVAWHAGNSEGASHPVGLKQPNAAGLHDMLGNVAEWTHDTYAPYPRADEDRDPTGPAAGSAKVVRGGSWRGFPPALRCAARTGTPAAYQQAHVGLRVVQDVD